MMMNIAHESIFFLYKSIYVLISTSCHIDIEPHHVTITRQVVNCFLLEMFKLLYTTN